MELGANDSVRCDLVVDQSTSEIGQLTRVQTRTQAVNIQREQVIDDGFTHERDLVVIISQQMISIRMMRDRLKHETFALERVTGLLLNFLDRVHVLRQVGEWNVLSSAEVEFESIEKIIGLGVAEVHSYPFEEAHRTYRSTLFEVHSSHSFNDVSSKLRFEVMNRPNRNPVPFREVVTIEEVHVSLLEKKSY